MDFPVYPEVMLWDFLGESVACEACEGQGCGPLRHLFERRLFGGIRIRPTC